MFGRDKDKEELTKILLDDNSQEKGIPVIAIVGIGGLARQPSLNLCTMTRG